MHALIALLAALLTACAAAAPKVSSRSPRAWSDDILYFVLVDRFADGDTTNDANVDRKAKGAFHGGDLKGLIANLDEISSLGVTAIWVHPLVKTIGGHAGGGGSRPGATRGSGPDVARRLDPRFGTEEDLRKLVEARHARGIKVLLDVVYNHAGYASRYLRDPKTRHWLRSSIVGDCGDDDLTSCLAGLPDFKTELPEVAKFLLDVQIGWAKRSGIDGFRLDTVKHVDHPFWQEHRKRTRAELSPDFFLLGEVWGGDADVLDPWFGPDELDAGFDFSFQGSVLGFVQGRGRTVAFNRYLEKRQKVRRGHLLAHFLSSHDVTGALYQLKGDVELFRLAVALQFTTSGIPVVYYGEEVARLGGEWPENRSDMPWGSRNLLPGAGLPRDDDLRRDYQKLIGIRRAHPALSRGDHAGLSTEGDLYVFARRDAQSGDAVVVAVNRGKEAASASFAGPPEWRSAAIVDLMDASSSGLAAGAGTMTITVAPRRFRILAAATR